MLNELLELLKKEQKKSQSQNQERFMSPDRMYELLCQLVSRISVDRDTNEQIEELTNLGFEMDELKFDFDFTEGDLMDFAEYCEERTEERE